MKRCDPDKPSTWSRFKPGMCESCWAGCCTMPLEVSAADLMRLGLVTEDEASESLKKVAKRLEREGVIQSYRAATQLFIITQKPNNDCLFLDSKTRLCTVYEKRPAVCRQFPNIGARPGHCPSGKK